MYVYNRLEVQIIQSIAKNTAISVLCRQNSPAPDVRTSNDGATGAVKIFVADLPRCWTQIMFRYFRSSNDQEIQHTSTYNQCPLTWVTLSSCCFSMMRVPSFQAAGSQAGFVVASLAKQRLWEPNEDQPTPQWPNWELLISSQNLAWLHKMGNRWKSKNCPKRHRNLDFELFQFWKKKRTKNRLNASVSPWSSKGSQISWQANQLGDAPKTLSKSDNSTLNWMWNHMCHGQIVYRYGHPSYSRDPYIMGTNISIINPYWGGWLSPLTGKHTDLRPISNW